MAPSSPRERQPLRPLRRALAVSTLLAALTATASVDAFLDNSYGKETFDYRGRSWTVPTQPQRAGGFDWDTVAGCVDYSGEYKYYCKDNKKMAISLDDGPDQYTAEALDILARNGATAVFCQMGSKMNSGTEGIIKRIADEGHVLCIHTENHLHLTELSTRQIIDEIMGTMDRFKKILGKTPRFFRPPFGEADMRVRAIVEQLGLTQLNWNLDTWDWKQNPAESLDRISRAMDTVGTWDVLMPGGPSMIWLGHDIHKETVQQVLEPSIKMARSKGWDVVSVTDASCLGLSRWLEDDWTPPKPTTTMANTTTVATTKTTTAASSSPATTTRRPIFTSIPPEEVIKTVTQTAVKPTEVHPIESAATRKVLTGLGYLSVLVVGLFGFL